MEIMFSYDFSSMFGGVPVRLDTGWKGLQGGCASSQLDHGLKFSVFWTDNGPLMMPKATQKEIDIFWAAGSVQKCAPRRGIEFPA